MITVSALGLCLIMATDSKGVLRYCGVVVVTVVVMVVVVAVMRHD